MRKWREVEVKPPMRLAPVEVICDRCAKPARIVGAINADRVSWGEASVYIQGGDFFRADLCHDCAKELKDWIDAGEGPGMWDREDYVMAEPKT